MYHDDPLLHHNQFEIGIVKDLYLNSSINLSFMLTNKKEINKSINSNDITNIFHATKVNKVIRKNELHNRLSNKIE